jgi:hypothetical protein
VSSSQGLRILGPMRALVSPSVSILVSLPLCFQNLENFFIYVSPCNSRNLCNNSVFGPCMCVLCVNASVLAPRMDPGLD